MNNDTFSQLAQLISDFEATDFQDKQLKIAIQTLAVKEVDWGLVENYYKSIDLEELCEMLLTPDIENWQTLTADERLALIQEIFDILDNSDTNQSIIDRNLDALEKYYPNQSVSDLIFWEDYNDAKIIFEILEKSQNS